MPSERKRPAVSTRIQQAKRTREKSVIGDPEAVCSALPDSAFPHGHATERVCAELLQFFDNTGVDVNWEHVRLDPDVSSGGWRVIANRNMPRDTILGVRKHCCLLTISPSLLVAPDAVCMP